MTPRDPVGDSVLSQTYREAMVLAEKMRANGEPPAAIRHAIATALQAAWPKGREEPWHYACDHCSDTGFQIKTCTHRSCGRPFKLPNQSGGDHTGQGTCTEGHSYADPCWCPKGAEKRRQLMKQPRAAEDAVEVAAKVGKPTRFGR